MPLVIVCGYPCSGKTRRALELKKAFETMSSSSDYEVQIISDESLHIEKSKYYDREDEKAARNQQMSAVKRMLTKNMIVILDGMSYIKGFRYQLYCEAKALETNSCVLYVGTPAETCKKWNSERQDGPAWPSDLLDALIFRFEEPTGMNRWDSPLFIVTPEDELPADEMWQALIFKKPVKPTPATSLKPAAPTDYLSVLNEKSAAIVGQVLDLHRDMAGSEVTLGQQKVVLPLSLTASQLNRIRRNFIQLNRTAAIPIDSIESFFVEFLQKNWEL